MIRQGSNLSKPNSRQTPRQTPGQTPRQTPGKKTRNTSINDAEFDRAIERQMSSLDKKKSQGNSRPRLGAPEAPKLGAPPKPPTPEPEPAPEPIVEETVSQSKNQTDATKTKKRRKKKREDGDSDEYSYDFETDSGDDDLDIITQVRDENNKFVMAKFDAVIKALSEASELPDLNEVDFDMYMEDQRQLILRREKTHSDWLENFVKKKQSVLMRLGIQSKEKGQRFNAVCNIAAGLLGQPHFPPPQRRSRSRSRDTLQERGRRRSRDKSRDRSRDTSRGRSRDRSYEKLKKNSSEVLPEIVDIKDDLFSSTPKMSATSISGAPPINGVA